MFRAQYQPGVAHRCKFINSTVRNPLTMHIVSYCQYCWLSLVVSPLYPKKYIPWYDGISYPFKIHLPQILAQYSHDINPTDMSIIGDLSLGAAWLASSPLTRQAMVDRISGMKVLILDEETIGAAHGGCLGMGWWAFFCCCLWSGTP